MACSIVYLLIFTTYLWTVGQADVARQIPVTSKCAETLKKYPLPDTTFAAKHLGGSCPELCQNSTGHHPTGQFGHPTDCNSFINCYQDDAWVHFCQRGLQFNEKTQQCDWPNKANCSRKAISSGTTPVSTTLKPTTTPLVRLLQATCKEPDAQFNILEFLGERPDLCTSGSGFYPAPDCRFYVRCNKTEASVAKCPGGFVFDGVNRRCDWPQKVENCLQLCSNFENTEKDRLPATTQTILVTTTPPIRLALQQSTLAVTSTTRTTTTTTTTTTAKPTTTQPPHDPLCKNISGNFEYENDCRKYVQCSDWHAQLHDCPSGLVFVKEKKWCNWTWMLPENHKCYKAFDNGSGDCPFTRDTNETTTLKPSITKTSNLENLY